ncbi:MAG: hypothetical protein ACRD2W_23665 [Acidimicrobiales bacterium]
MATKQRPTVVESPVTARPGTTFDLYFVTFPRHGDWSGVMLDIERSPWRTQPFDDKDHELWQKMAARVGALLPGSEVRSIAGMHELTHARSGIQFSYVPGGVVLTVPYWYTGDDADRLVRLLQRIAQAIEVETSLIAYDPQAEAPFLAYGAGSAAATFQERCQAEFALGQVPSPKLPRGTGWRRLCRS